MGQLRARFSVYLAAAGLAAAPIGFGQVVPGPNVNIVANDPYNQKQLEVDAAANPLNPNHVFAGYIDYQTVGSEDSTRPPTSKGRCGFSFSTNGGKTWKNGLIPSVLNGDTCGDPSVAWDTSGHVFYFGLSKLTDGVTTVMSIARLSDPDDGMGSINLDSFVQIDAGTSSTGQVLDKTSMIFQPDATPGASPTAPGTLYACYANFTGSQNNTVTKITCSISRDGGLTYTKPNQGKYNGTINSGNGTSIAPGPNGSAYVAWRAFSVAENGYYFVNVKPDGTATSPMRVVGASGFYPYDAETRSDMARSEGFPSIVSDGGQRIAIAFQAYSAPNGSMAPPGFVNTPRIFVTYSSNGGTSWSTPSAIDYGPHVNTFQFMPRGASSAGVFSFLYYDARNDNCFDQEPATPAACGRPISLVNGDYIPAGRDRRFDVRIIQGQFDSTGKLNFFAPSTQVTRYDVSASTHQITQRNRGCPAPGCPALNYPFLPVGGGGTVAFMGDYIAHAPKVQFLRNPAGSALPAWRLANQPGDPLTFIAFWADFRGVAFPLNSEGQPDINGSWTQFVPAGFPACINPKTRDSNILFSEITNGGLAVGVKGTTRPAVSGNTPIPPDFTVGVQNLSGRDLYLRLTVTDTAPAEDWSLVQTLPSPALIPGDDNSVDVRVRNHSGFTQTVYYRWRSSNPSTPVIPVTIRLDEIAAVGGALVPGGLTTTVTYNPATSKLPVSGPAHNLTVGSPTVTSFSSSKAQPSNSLVENSLVENSLVENSLIENSLIENSLIENSLVPDQQVLWTVTGGGPLTTASTAFSNVSNGQELLQAGWKFQLLIYQTQSNPNVNACALVPTNTDVVLSNIAITQPNTSLIENRQVSNSLIENSLVENSLIENSPISDQISNATFSVDSGEQVKIALRAYKPRTSGQVMLLTGSPTPTFNPSDPTQIGVAVFGQAADPLTGATVGAFFDTTPPVITPNVVGTLGQNGWYVSAVTVTWSVIDAQSGVVSKTGCAPITITSDTNGTTLQCSAVNGANLSNTASVTVKIDRTPPTVTASVSPVSPAATGWYNLSTGVPAVSFTCTDTGSGVASCPAPVLVGDGSNQTVSSGPVQDLAGNQAVPATVSGLKVDTVKPAAAITAPANNASYVLNAPVSSSYACSDATSGVASCTGPVPSGTNINTSIAGAKTFTVTATDVAGNTASQTSSYFDVFRFVLTLPKSPAQLGSAVPLNWQLLDFNKVITDISTLVSLTAIKNSATPPAGGTCPAASSAGASVSIYSPATGWTGNSGLRVVSSQFQVNWDTTTVTALGAGCYTVAWQLSDNTTSNLQIADPARLRLTTVQLK